MGSWLGTKPVLLVVAAPTEAQAVARGLGTAWPARAPSGWEPISIHPRFDLVLTGVGKSNAAGGTAAAILGSPDRFSGVLSIGIGGLLPRGADEGLAIGDCVVTGVSCFADEGVATPGGFVPMADLGFPSVPEAGDEISAYGWLAPVLARTGSVGRIATVSACSGTDDRAANTSARTGALVEAMEGAAVGLVCRRLAVEAFGEVRIVSNTTGARDDQRWDLPGALETLSAVAESLARIEAG